MPRDRGPRDRRASRRLDSQGQWAVDGTTPLNAVEELKAERSPLDLRERIEQVHARDGFDSIPPADLKERLKWWGLYTQRRQDADATETGAAPEALMDRYFMLRIRTDGGLLDAAQLRAIGGISTEFGRDVADVTDRQNIQLHWIRIEDMPEIWARLDTVGLGSVMACGDVPRGFLGCPVAGRAHDEVVDATAVLQATAARAVGNPAFVNLPRKFKTSIAGCAQQCAQPDVNDVAFVGVRQGPEVGFAVWVGGGLGSNPHLAQPLGVFVTPDEVPDVWEAVAGAFRDHGYRKSRKRARLKFLVADIGTVELRRIMEAEYLHRPLRDLDPGIVEAPSGPAGTDHVGVFDQSDGRRYVGAAPRAGRIAGHQLSAVADLAARHGSGAVTLTTQQKVIVPDVAPEAVEDVVAALEAHDLRPRSHPLRSGMMACTGIEFCKLALAETKGRAQELYRALEQRLPDWDEPLRITVNGCPNSCARFQIADIGFMGALVADADGGRGEGFLVHLGGGVGVDRGFARKVPGVKVPAADLVGYTETLLRRYLEQGALAGGFTRYVRSLDREALAVFAAPVGQLAGAR